MKIEGAPDWLDYDLDLGDDHWLHFVTSAENKDEHVGAVVYHRCSKTESGWDSGFIQFDIAGIHNGDGPKWNVASWKPLTLTPSLLQRGCGDHGFITAGKWVRA